MSKKPRTPPRKAAVKKKQVRYVRANKRSVKTFGYPTYNFVDKDPVIDVVRTAVGKTPLAKIERDSGVSVSCLRSWFVGSTNRPQFATVRAVLAAVGAELTIKLKEE